MDKRILVLPVLLILSVGYVLSQSESFVSPEIEPSEDDMIHTTFMVTFVNANTGEEKQKIIHRYYPVELLNWCDYGRYGDVIRCRNVLKEEMENDLKNWYKYRLPLKVKTRIKLKDLTLIGVNYDPLKKWIGCRYDFINEGLSC